MKQYSRRFLSMGLALIMIIGMLTAGIGALAEDAGITFPESYTADLVVPTLDSDAVEAKVEALIKTMTVEEKFSFLGGSGTGMEGNAGALPGVPRLGVPEVKMYDGPAGLLYPEDTTNPPQEQMLAATWSEEMARLYGGIVSAENKEIGGGMMLSAQLDIQRVPQFGRTKDQMGEDPYLLASLADDLVGGMQSEGSMTVKQIAGTEDELGNVSGPNANQGTQYYSSIVPTETGMNVASLDVELKAETATTSSSPAPRRSPTRICRCSWPGSRLP